MHRCPRRSLHCTFLQTREAITIYMDAAHGGLAAVTRKIAASPDLGSPRYTGSQPRSETACRLVCPRVHAGFWRIRWRMKPSASTMVQPCAVLVDPDSVAIASEMRSLIWTTGPESPTVWYRPSNDGRASAFWEGHKVNYLQRAAGLVGIARILAW